MIKKVGIVGLGQMGSGIAQVAAGNYKVVANEVAGELIDKGLGGIEKRLNCNEALGCFYLSL